MRRIGRSDACLVCTQDSCDLAKVLLKAKGDNLPGLAALTLPIAGFPITAQLVNPDTGICWESSFGTSDTKKNTATIFKAKN